MPDASDGDAGGVAFDLRGTAALATVPFVTYLLVTGPPAVDAAVHRRPAWGPPGRLRGRGKV